jgi:hypothetical protein
MRYLALICVLLLVVSVMQAQEETPPVEVTETVLPTATEFPSVTATLEAVQSPEVPPTSTLEPAPSLTPEATEAVEILPLPENEATEEPTPLVEFTPEPEPSATATVSPLEPSVTMTATETLAQLLTGIVRYQSRVPDDSGISVFAYSLLGELLATAQTDATGSYLLAVPVEVPYLLYVTAPLHRPYTLLVEPGEMLPEMTLAGGDLDGDGCIDTLDLALLTAQFGLTAMTESDISGDGVTDASDLAILTGNFDPLLCVRLPFVVQPEETPEVTEEN